MKTASTITCAFLTSAVTSFAVAYLIVPGDPVAPSDQRSELDQLQRDHRELQQKFDALHRREVAPQAAPNAVTSRTRIDADAADLQQLVHEAVQRALAQRSDAGLPGLDVAVSFRDLTGNALTAAEKQTLWQRLRDAGQLDEMLAEFERRAAAQPADATMQSELAFAYQHRMLAAENGPERGKWGAKAAASLENALRIDAFHWDARNALAQHSYWADMRGDAERHFRTLIEQQGRRVAEPKHATAYLWLGNMLLDRGKKQEAIRAWNDGLTLFPSHQGLQKRLDANR